MAPGTPCQDKRKFIVFYSALLTVFSLFCFICKTNNPKVSMDSCGTMVTVTQHCQSCKKNFKWRSQPFILGRYPAGNVLLSFAVLMAGASISKVLLVFKHMGISVYESRTFFYHQSRFLFPTILKYWETYQASLLTKIKGMKDAVWSGDGRFDSMGHSAKFGAYTLLCSPVMKIVHFELLQVIVIQKYWVFHFNSSMIFSEHTTFTKCIRFSTWKNHLHFCPKTTTKCSKLWTVQGLE